MNTDLFWYLARARYQMYENRLLLGTVVPTGDPILDENRFTNTFRVTDRVSQRLLQVQQGGPQDAKSLVLRTLLFKIFNKESTWDAIVAAVGEPAAGSYDPEAIKAALDNVDGPIFGNAYIMSSSLLTGRVKHHFFLDMLTGMMDRVEDFLVSTSLGELVAELQSTPGIGPFLSYQYAIDLNYTDLFRFSEDSFVQAGPGALRGLQKLFGNSRMAPDKIRLLAEERDRGPLLMGEHPMRLIDIQNVLCEYDKYTRVQGGKRMKQRYRVDPRPLPDLVLPAHW